jgi:hypothetical protein
MFSIQSIQIQIEFVSIIQLRRIGIISAGITAFRTLRRPWYAPGGALLPGDSFIFRRTLLQIGLKSIFKFISTIAEPIENRDKQAEAATQPPLDQKSDFPKSRPGLFVDQVSFQFRSVPRQPASFRGGV